VVNAVKPWEQRILPAGSTLLLLLAFIGCADVLDIPSDPKLVATGPWRCLTQPSLPVTGVPTVAQAMVSVHACDFISDCTTAVTGLTAKLCDKKDVGCNSPRLSGITDTNGDLHFEVPTAAGGFNGYLLVDSSVASCTDSDAFGTVAGSVLCSLVAPDCDLAAPDARCSAKVFAPAMLFFNPPIVGDSATPLPLQLFPTSSLPSVLAAAGIAIDPTAGNLFIQALDCDGRPAADVTYKIGQYGNQVSSLYVTNGIVTTSATHTDATGVGGFVRVPPGFVSVIGYTSDSVAIGEIGVQTAASTLTYSALFPSP
jgi:hypothetical protein